MILGLKNIKYNWIHVRNYLLIIILIVVPLFATYYSNEPVKNAFITSEESNLIDESAISDYIQEKIWDTNGNEKIEQNYNPAIGNIVREFCKSCTNEESISKIAFSPNNRLLAGGTNNGKIFIWDITTEKTKYIWNNSNYKINNLEWTVDSKTLITAGQGSKLNYWNVSSGELINQIDLYPRILEIANLDLSNDGKTLAIASGEKTVSLWDINGTFIKLLTEDTVNTPLDIKFSTHGSLLALYTLKGSVWLWDSSTSELLFQIQAGSLYELFTTQPGYKGNYIDFSLDSKLLFISRNGLKGLLILDTATGTEIQRLYPQDPILSVSNSKTKNLIITGSDTDVDQIKIYDYIKNETILQIQDESTIAVDFSYDGALAASVNLGGTVRLWNTISGTELTSFKGHLNNIIQTKFLNSSILVSSSKDDTVKVWKNNELLYQISNASMENPYAVDITETPEKDILVAIGTGYGKIFLFNSSQPTSLRQYLGHQAVPPGVPKILSIDFSPNSSLFVSSGLDGYNIVWDSYSTDLVQKIVVGNLLSGYNAYFLGNDKIIGNGKLRITIWDLKTLATQTYSVTFGNVDGNLASFDYMKVSEDLSMVVAVYRSNYIAILNLTDSNLKILIIDGLLGPSYFDFTPDNKYLLEASGKDQLLRIWDLGTLNLVFSSYMDLPNPFIGDFNPVNWTMVVSYKQEDEIVFLDMSPLKNGRLDLLDFDSDGISDIWEQQNSLQNDNYYDRFEDPDNDQLMNWEEFNQGINSTNPQSSDTDGDGITDTYEKQYNMDPLVNDANGDIDGDGMNNLYEYQMGLDSSLNDSYFDYDNDGLTNLQEFQYQTDVHKADTDGDGMDDKWEVMNKLNPTDAGDALLDYDLDGISNFDEYRYGSDPNSFISVPLVSLNYFYLAIVLISIAVTTLGYYQYRKYLVAEYMAPDYFSAVKVRKAKLEDWYQYIEKEKELEKQIHEAKRLFIKGLVNQSLVLYQTIMDQALKLGKMNSYAETLIRIYYIEIKLLKGGKDSFSYLNIKYPFKGNNVLLKEYNRIIEGYESEKVHNTGLALELWNSVVESDRVVLELSLIVQYSIVDLQINRFQANKSQDLFKEINIRITHMIRMAKEKGYPEYICGSYILSARLYFNRYNIKNALEALDKAKEIAKKEHLDFYLVKANEEVENFDKIKSSIKKGLSLKDTALEERDFEEYMKQIKDYASLAKDLLAKED